MVNFCEHERNVILSNSNEGTIWSKKSQKNEILTITLACMCAHLFFHSLIQLFATLLLDKKHREWQNTTHSKLVSTIQCASLSQQQHSNSSHAQGCDVRGLSGGSFHGPALEVTTVQSRNFTYTVVATRQPPFSLYVPSTFIVQDQGPRPEVTFSVLYCLCRTCTPL